MKLLGIDYGRRRIGVAATDESGTLARGIGVVDRKKRPDTYAALQEFVRSEKPDALVVGLPLDPDARETRMSREVRKFAGGLARHLSLPVHFVDESLTSRRASELLLARKRAQRHNKEMVDRLSACLILEAFREGLVCDD